MQMPSLRPAGNYIVQVALNPPLLQPRLAVQCKACTTLLHDCYERCLGQMHVTSFDCLFLIADINRYRHALVHLFAGSSGAVQHMCLQQVFEASYNSVLHICSAAQLMIMQQRIPSVSLEALARSRAFGQSLAIRDSWAIAMTDNSS